MWEWRTSFGWADVAFWALLVIVILAILVGAWWPTRRGNGP
jgi:hypothetical protein